MDRAKKLLCLPGMVSGERANEMDYFSYLKQRQAASQRIDWRLLGQAQEIGVGCPHKQQGAP